jgi:hypothetical protein
VSTEKWRPACALARRSASARRSEAAPARAGNAAGGFFQQTIWENKVRIKRNRIVLDVLLVALRIGKSSKALMAQNFSFKIPKGSGDFDW